MIKRDDFSLYLCQLCILRSQCPKLARNFLDEKRENEAALDRLKQVEDDDTNRIPGIRVVTGAIKKQMDDRGITKKSKSNEKNIFIEDDEGETVNPDTYNNNHDADTFIKEEESDTEQRKLEAILEVPSQTKVNTQ